MNVHQAMQYYQQTIDYYRTPAIDYFLIHCRDMRNRKDMAKLFVAFIDICSFPDLLMGMLKKVPQEEVIRDELKKHEKEWEGRKKMIEDDRGD